ncbi:probable thiol methyltransferase 2 isoform X2 [Lolium perenne]|uniref:probable thiol methyltransferase 2 isoform X2 n=1 Tax=Lolium perenne TaxID=4522 RepID=UPI0021F5DB74|nr:probable thiol methyltransferase 2 isoform X2 [Lolium perenne]
MHALSRPVLSRARPLLLAAAMGSSSGRDPSGHPAVGRLRELFRGGGDAADGWDKSWESGITPWDLGKPTPVIQHLAKSGTLPNGRALVPGCGMGYDVVALASPERFVVGLEISNIATEKAKQWSSSLPNADWFTFLVADFFKWRPSEPFDLIFDYMLAWAETVSRLLKPDGELITLIYLISDQEGGPPYNNTVADYQKVLEPLGFKAVSMEDNELAIKPRMGYEKLGRWKRCCGPQSSL